MFRLIYWMLSASLVFGGILGCTRVAQPPEVVASSTKSTTPPLIKATLAGDEVAVKSLLKAGSDPNTVYRTNTALTYASRDGFTEIAQRLIDAGADVNWIDGEGVTPLILAAFKGHVDLAKLLLAHGANTTIRDQWDRSALDYALRRGNDDPIVLLLIKAR